MPYAIRQLIARGYWAPAGDEGTQGGSGGTGSGDEGKTGDDGKSGEGKDDGKTGDDGKSGTKKTGPTDAEAELLREVMDKKNKNKELADQLAQAKDALKKFEGLDAEQIRAMLKEADDRKVKDLEAKGNWEALRKQMADQHEAAVKAAQDALDAAKSEAATLQGQIAELTVGNSFGQSNFIKSEMVLPVSKVRALFGSHFAFENGSVVAYDKPAGSKGRSVLVDAKGEPLSFESAIQKLVEADPDRDSILKSKTRAGSGSGTERGVKAPARTVELTGANRIAAALAQKKK
jgi:hypothetical protein